MRSKKDLLKAMDHMNHVTEFLLMFINSFAEDYREYLTFENFHKIHFDFNIYFWTFP